MYEKHCEQEHKECAADLVNNGKCQKTAYVPYDNTRDKCNTVEKSHCDLKCGNLPLLLCKHGIYDKCYHSNSGDSDVCVNAGPVK